MFDSPLSRLAVKLGILALRCEYSSKCKHFKRDSDTCMKALDKTYCGAYNVHFGGEQSE